MASYLITGCSRGLGLALAAHLLSFPASEVGTIIATSRTQSAAQKELAVKSGGRVQFVQLETTNESNIKHAVTEAEKILDGKGLDVLINNAAISLYTPDGIASMYFLPTIYSQLKTNDQRNDLDKHFDTNVLSVHHVTRAFVPLLQKGGLKKVVNV